MNKYEPLIRILSILVILVLILFVIATK